MTTAVDEAIEHTVGTGMMIRERSAVVLMPVLEVAVAKTNLEKFQEFCQHYLTESKDGGDDGGDYGVIPGTRNKMTLLKSGADKLCEIYGLADEYKILSKTEDWDSGLFDYMLECTLRSRRDDSFLGTGLGSCSTFESRYRWRQAQRLCPQCRQAAIIKGKQEYGGGWLCFKNKGGCGAKFNDNDPNIISQEVGRVENPDIADAKNTVLKMAKKRAKIDAVIGVTRSAGMFTQDMEDLSHQPIIDVKAVVLDGPTLKQAVEQTIGPAIVAAVEPKVEPSVAQTGPGPEPGPEVVASHAGVKVTAVDKLKSGTNSRGGWNLYVVKFGGAVKASDGQNANSATTLDEKVAAQAEDYRSSGALVLPVLEPGNKRGSYNVTKFDLPVSR